MISLSIIEFAILVNYCLVVFIGIVHKTNLSKNYSLGLIFIILTIFIYLVNIFTLLISTFLKLMYFKSKM